MTDLIAVQRIAGGEKLKTLVLDSVSSPITKRAYNMALLTQRACDKCGLKWIYGTR